MESQQPGSARRGAKAATATGSEWFYIQRGETYGPVSSRDLCAAAHLGFLGPDDLVRRADDLRWMAAGTIHGLFEKRD